MSNTPSNASSPSATVVRSTVPETAAPTSGAAPDASPSNAPPFENPASGVASDAEVAASQGKPAPAKDENLEVAKRWDKVAAREAKARRADLELQAKMGSISEREKKLAEREAKMEAFESDPIKFLMENGKDPVAIAERFAKPETEEEKRIRKLEEAHSAREKAEAERKKKWETQQKEARKHESLVKFVKEISPDECPALTTMYEAHEVPALINKLLFAPADPTDPEGETFLEMFQGQYGRRPTDGELRELLEYHADLMLQRVVKGHQARTGAPGAQSDQQAEQPPTGVTGPSSISNQHAAVTTSGKKAVSREEARKRAREEITAALEAEAASRRSE